jgi:Leucine-rich repeat (LRR) protein
VAGLILRCNTTKGVVEKHVKHDALIAVRNDLHVAQLSPLCHCLQLQGIGLTDVPPELFRLTNARKLYLYNNNLCSLPREISHLVMLEGLRVRRSKRI